MGHYDENGDFKGSLDRYSEIKTCIVRPALAAGENTEA